MEDWGSSSFVEAAIGLNLASAFWQPFEKIIKGLPSVFETVLLDWQTTTAAQAAAGKGKDSHSVTENVARKCQETVVFYQKAINVFWSIAVSLIWLSTILSLATLYFGPSQPK